MNQFIIEPAGRGTHYDHLLIAVIILLTGIGLVTLYSASYAFGERFFGNGLYFFSHQVVLGAMGGFLLFFMALRIPLRILRKCIVPLVVGTIVMCLCAFIPGIGVTKNGATRWIHVGSYTYQPSELVKLVVPLYLAHIFAKKQDKIRVFSTGILPPALVTTLFFLLIYLQNNFSTALFIAVNALLVFFFVGVQLRYFVGAGVILVPLSALLVFTKEHRLRRLISFIWPEWEPLGAGYQVRSSLLTIESGGFLGKGIGQGVRKIASVPEVHSDFIFSAYAEEAGFIGILLFFILFGLFTVRGYRAVLQADDAFARFLAFGLVTTISSQILLNISVVSGVLPATGIPLPFFSHGGSSLATTLLCAGLIVNISGLPRELDSVRSTGLFREPEVNRV
ncbi:MAG: putative lipid II flippase FtsW [Spirochaetaceae bacterium]|jgi:cell division protein FtsW|nr:putative lipid II flippase FtsW [Spirochaetaceae bacterium]